jgi:hypothetical protein
VARSLSVDERRGHVRGHRDLVRAKGVALYRIYQPLSLEHLPCTKHRFKQEVSFFLLRWSFWTTLIMTNIFMKMVA